MKLFHAMKMRWLVWVWRHTPNCAEMARLASRSLDQPLSLKVRGKIRLHHLICVWCRRYQQHVQFLHHAAPRMQAEVATTAHRGLSAEAKRRIAERLRAECPH